MARGTQLYGMHGLARSRQPQTREVAPRVVPQIRIHRFASLDAVDNMEWDGYLAVLSRVNWSDNPMNLGKMAVTYVESRELNDMLANRYPDSYNGRRKDIINIHRGFAASFREFMLSDLQAQLIMEQSRESLEATPRHFNMWRKSVYATRQHARPYGAHALGVDMSLNPTLNAELESVRDFLQHDEKLDLKFLRYKQKELHIKVLSTESDFSVRPPKIPTGLLPPEMVYLEAPDVWREPEK